MFDEKLGALRDYFGSYTKMAAALGVTPQAINDWKVKRKIPPMSAIKIEQVSGGKFKAIELV